VSKKLYFFMKELCSSVFSQNNVSQNGEMKYLVYCLLCLQNVPSFRLKHDPMDDLNYSNTLSKNMALVLVTFILGNNQKGKLP
jgi:hypothetical protein